VHRACDASLQRLDVAAADVTLTEEDRQQLDEAAPRGAAVGDRYPDMSTVHR
jgi:hypothetical protein